MARRRRVKLTKSNMKKGTVLLLSDRGDGTIRVVKTGNPRMMRWEGVGDLEPHYYTTDADGNYSIWEALSSLNDVIIRIIPKEEFEEFEGYR
jgi:hypothetical protein